MISNEVDRLQMEPITEANLPKTNEQKILACLERIEIIMQQVANNTRPAGTQAQKVKRL